MPQPQQIAQVKAALAEVEQAYAESPITQEYLRVTAGGGSPSKSLVTAHGSLRYLLDLAQQSAEQFVSGPPVTFEVTMTGLAEHARKMLERGAPRSRRSVGPASEADAKLVKAAHEAAKLGGTAKEVLGGIDAAVLAVRSSPKKSQSRKGQAPAKRPSSKPIPVAKPIIPAPVASVEVTAPSSQRPQYVEDEFVEQMRRDLTQFGYDPSDASRLRAEGMGPAELLRRLQTQPAEGIGGIEFTHNLRRMGVPSYTLEETLTIWGYDTEAADRLRGMGVTPAVFERQMNIDLSGSIARQYGLVHAAPTLVIYDPDAIKVLTRIEGPNWFRRQEKDRRRLIDPEGFYTNRQAFQILRDMGPAAQGLTVADVVPSAGMIAGEQGRAYALLPDGEIALLGETVLSDMRAEIAKHMAVV